MALRFRDFVTVADILVLSNNPVDAVFLLRQTNLLRYPVANILLQVDEQGRGTEADTNEEGVVVRGTSRGASERGPRTTSERRTGGTSTGVSGVSDRITDVSDVDALRIQKNPQLQNCIREIQLWQEQCREGGSSSEGAGGLPNVAGCEAYGLFEETTTPGLAV